MLRIVTPLVTVLGALALAAPAYADPSASQSLADQHAKLDAGALHTCAVQAGGVVRCWGDGASGKLGTGATEDIGDFEHPAVAPPVDLGPGRTAVAVSAASSHTCALLDEGSVRCWGEGSSGRLGTGATGDVGDDEAASAGALVDLGGQDAKAISAGGDHTCAILADDSLRCWGENDRGQLGYGGHTDVLVPAAAGPVPLPAGRTVRSVSAGGDHTCAILDDFSLRCWGAGVFGISGHGNEDEVSEAGALEAVVYLGVNRTARSIAMGGNHACAILDDASVRCWGIGWGGRLGYGNEEDIGDDETPGSAGPVSLGAGRTAKSIVVGGLATCAILDDDTMRCWGTGAWGQIGMGDHADVGDDELPSDVPVVSPGPGRTVLAAAMGAEYSCWRLDDGNVRCAGWSYYGQAGTAANDPLYGGVLNNEERPLAQLPDLRFSGGGTDVSAWVQAAGSGPLAIGGKRAVEIAVVNAGPDPVGGVVVTLTPSAGLTLAGDPTWNVGTLPPGAVKTIEAEVTGTAAGARTLTAEVTAAGAADHDSTPGNGAGADEDDDAVAAVPVVPGADLSVDLAMSGADLVRPAHRSAKVTVTNDGPAATNGVKVWLDESDGLQPQPGWSASKGSISSGTWNVGTLAPGESATVDLTVASLQTGAMQFRAEVSASSEPDPDSADRKEIQAFTAVAGADLALTLPGGDATVALGETRAVTLSVHHGGGGATTTVAADVAVPAGLEIVNVVGGGTWDAAQRRLTMTNLPSGASPSATLYVKAVAPGAHVLGAQIATSTAPDHDSTPGNGLDAAEDDAARRTLTVPEPPEEKPTNTNTTTTTTTTTTTPPPPPPPPGDALQLASVASGLGRPRVTVHLIRPADLRITLARHAGRAWRTVGTHALRGPAGRTTHRLPRRLTGTRLRPGLYRVTVEAEGVRIVKSFRVPRRRR